MKQKQSCEMCPSKHQVKLTDVEGVCLFLCPDCAALVLAPEPVTTDRSPVKGTFLNGALISPYFQIEHYSNSSRSTQRPTEARPSRPLRLGKVRRRLEVYEKAHGIDHPTMPITRPNAGQPLVGPLPLPQSRPAPLASPFVPGVRFDPDFPDENQRTVCDWYFRSGLNREKPLMPSWMKWPIEGLQWPDGQEA